jgi:hypothetical protein
MPSKLPLILFCATLSFILVTVGYSLGKNSVAVATYVFKISPTPTPTPLPYSPLLVTLKTSHWLTYKNEVYGYSIKYPPVLSIQTDENRALFSKEIDPKQIADASYQIIVTVEDGTQRDVDLAVESVQEKYKNVNYKIEYTLLGTIKAQKITGIGNEWPQTIVIGTDGIRMYTVQLALFDADHTEASSFFDSMLSTFVITQKK